MYRPRPSVRSVLSCAGVLACSLWWAPAARAQDPASNPSVSEPDSPEEIVVTASPNERRFDQLAIPVDVLSRDELLDRAGGTVGDTLSSRAGVTTTSFAAGASRPVIRGQDQLRVRVLENGIGTGDASALSADHGVSLNPLVTQRLEVVRGPASLRYGGGAIAGVVNAITGRIPSERVSRGLQSELFSSYGTGARERNLAGLLRGDAGPVSWHLDAYSSDTRDFDVPGSEDREFNTWTDGYSFSGGAAWFSETLRIGGSVSRFRNDYGIPAPEDPADPSRITLEQDHYAFEADVNPGGSFVEQLRLRGARTEYLHDEVVPSEGAAATFDNEDLELRAELAHQPFAGFTGAFGVQFQDIDFQAAGEASELLPPSETNLYGAYLFESTPLTDRLDLELAGRVERVVVRGTTPAGLSERRAFTPLSASASLLYGLTDAWALGLTLTTAQRAPDALELFSQGPHDATETFETGTPDADEERSYTADLLVRGTWGAVSGQLNLFYTDYEDFTYGRLTGNVVNEEGDPPGPGDETLDELFYTQDDATFRGGELELRYDLGELWRGRVGLEFQADYVRARLSSGNVPRIPPLRWGGALVYESDRLTSRIGFLRHAAQNDLADRGEDRTSGYTTLDAFVRLRLAGSRERPVDLTLSGRNLLDARGRNHVSFKKEDVLIPGRDVRVGLHMRF